MTDSLVTVETRGSHRAVGRAIGEASRDLAQGAIEYYAESFRELSGIEFRDAERSSVRLQTAARRALPELMDELEGMAEGAHVPFSELFVLNCGEEFLCAAERVSRCTNVSITATGRVLGHNEDWVPDDAGRNVLIRMTLEDGTSILTISAAGYLPATGVNSHGVAVAANTLYASDDRGGIPNSFICRSVLEARSADDAVARASIDGRARGSNFHVVTAGGETVDIETSATMSASRRPSDWYAHTNHYLERDMLGVEASFYQGSRRRLGRVCGLVEEGLRQDRGPREIVLGVLRDHATAPYSICAHPSDELPVDEQVITCASQIWDLEAGEALICAGPPCSNDYVSHPLP